MYTASRHIIKSTTLTESVSISKSRYFATSHIKSKRRKDNDKTKQNPVKSTPGMRMSIANALGSNKDKDSMSVFKPVMVKPNPDDLNFGEEIAGKINKSALLKAWSSAISVSSSVIGQLSLIMCTSTKPH